MAIEEVYTPVGRQFGDGCIMEQFWAKRVISVLGASLERWRLMALVVIVENQIFSESSGLETQNWLYEIRDDGAKGGPHMPRNKQGSEGSPEQMIVFAEPSQLHIYTSFSYQTIASTPFWSNFYSYILVTSGTSLP